MNHRGQDFEEHGLQGHAHRHPDTGHDDTGGAGQADRAGALDAGPPRSKAEILESWGGELQFAGPVIRVPCERVESKTRKTERVQKTLLIAII